MDYQNIRAQLGLRNVYVFKALGDDALARVSALWSDHRLADWNAHADLIAPFIASQAAPQDEFFDLQWHLDNDGSFPGSVNADIDVLSAWETSKGANVRVIVRASYDSRNNARSRRRPRKRVPETSPEALGWASAGRGSATSSHALFRRG